MSLKRLIQELFITQVSAGVVSFLASSTIVTFVALKGFSNPYRRIIFGLSISDICQSLGLVFGPFLIEADVKIPQAIWASGNRRSCQLSGLLTVLGMNAVPMYTLGLCIYYVCKCKNKMTDSQFAHRVEKKMHIFIIVFNVGLYFTAFGMGTINPGALGNLCLPAAAPAGCRLNPEIFGECDPFIATAAHVFNVISTAIVPIASLVGIIVCMAMLFWNVIMVERISFGAAAPAPVPLRNRLLRRGRGRTDADAGTRQQQEEQQREDQPHPDEAPTTPRDESEIENRVSVSNPESSEQEITSSILRGGSDFSDLHTIQEAPNETSQQSSAEGRGSTGLYSGRATSNTYSSTISPVTSTEAARQLGSVSRLYKRELVTQAVLYVVVFCLSSVPFLASNLIVLSGKRAPVPLLRGTVLFYPLAGFFNIIIYTRLNVASFRKKHPECSWLRAFWWVLKAGGEMPNDNEWLERSDWWNLTSFRFGDSRSVDFHLGPNMNISSSAPPPPQSTPEYRYHRHAHDRDRDRDRDGPASRSLDDVEEGGQSYDSSR